MNLFTVLIVLLVLAAIFGLPQWGYTQRLNAGYWPSGLFGVILVVVVLYLLLGRSRL